MPARIVDGDSLWTSKKLKEVPLEYRGEYANLLPLSAVNGTFDPDPDLIHRTVYAYNRPNITREDVVKMLEAFERAGMISMGETDGKTWATFVGIEKEGRLPPPSRRYGSNLPPSPEEFLGTVTVAQPYGDRSMTERFGSQDRIGKEEERTGEDSAKVKQKGLPYLKLIPQICRSVFGVRAEKEEWYKSDLKELAETYGGTELVTAFEEWAKQEPTTPRNPVKAFIRVADGFLQNKVKQDDPALEALCISLYNIGGQVFTGRYRQLLNSFITEFSFSEIEKAYKDFVSEKDDYGMKFVVRDFCEGGAKTLILAARKQIEDQERQKAIIEFAIESEQQKVEQVLEEEGEPL